MRDVHGLAAGRNEFRPGLNCDLFRSARVGALGGLPVIIMRHASATVAQHLFDATCVQRGSVCQLHLTGKGSTRR